LIVHMIRGFESNCIRQNSNLKEKDLEVLVWCSLGDSDKTG
jgi:hypothetical protein